MKIFIALLTLAATSMAATPTVNAEVDSLLTQLKHSGCKFQRNGSWFEAPKASDHLGTKRDYFAKKGKLNSAEDFIRLAGTESSMTGKAYRVACPDQPEVDSKVWLETQLKRIRAKK